MVKVTSENLYKEVFNQDIPVVIFFESVWSKACRHIIADFENPDVINNVYKMCRVNTDESPELVLRYSIKIVPEFVIFYKRDVRSQIMGYITPEMLMQEVKRIMELYARL